MHLKDLDVDASSVKTDLKQIGRGSMDWSNLAQDWGKKWRALVNTVMHIRAPLNAGKFLTL